MERKRTSSSIRPVEEQAQATSETMNGTTEVMSIAQIQGLVKILDHSDVSELELRRASEGLHLVLRKAKAPDGSVSASETVSAASDDGAAPAGDSTAVGGELHTVVAPLVGIFHPWLKPGGGTLVAVGDHVKVGQLVGTIESLNVINEVEAAWAGRVLEIHVRDGQPVEYGQALVTLDSSPAEEV